MSTVAEIEDAIIPLSPDDFGQLHDWMSKRAEAKATRIWTAAELTEGARRIVEEPDPDKAAAIWEEVTDGFYGEANA